MTQGKSQTNEYLEKDAQEFNVQNQNQNEGSVTTVSKETSTIHPVAPGFLGSTSYSAVFTEGESHINLELEMQAQHGHLPPERPKAFALDSTVVREGAQVLTLLGNLSQYQRAADRWFQIACLCQLNPFVQECVDLMAMGDIVGGSINNVHLMHTSQMIFERTAMPIDVKNIRSMSQIPAFFMGENLCWEVVGLVLMVAGLGAISLDEISLDSDDEGCDWKELAKTWLQAGDKCKFFCQEFGQLNDLGVWQILLNHVLHTQVYGDADPASWRTLGDLVAAVFAMGLHQDPKSISEIPFFLVEQRRKVFWFAYRSDKNFATFFGRPPMVSGKYCSAKLPLDIMEDQLGLEGEALAGILSGLNDEGWNLHGPITRVSWLRVSFISSLLREDILELSLGIQSDELQERARQVQARLELVYEKLPFKLRDRSQTWVLDRSMNENFIHLSIHLDRVYNEFLIQRTLVKRLKVIPTELVKVSRALLSSLLVLLGNRHRLGPRATDLPWLIALYGLPPAGVLALELLQQFRAPLQADQSFPRSEIVQNLSNLISSIECIVRPTSGNHGICTQAKKMLQAILDIVLSPAQPDVNTENYDDRRRDANRVVCNGLGSQTWFDQDLDMDFWMNLEEHPLLVWPEAPDA